MATRRRSDLFLVRLWVKDANNSSDKNDKAECHGKVQRVVDGQSREFDSWQGLVDLLVVMLSSSKGR